MRKMKFYIITLLIILIGVNSLTYIIGRNEKYSLNQELAKQITANVPDYTQLGKVPQDFIYAIIATEDHRFFEHHGFDGRSIGRAFLTNMKAGEIREGGSTITQQLAKNLFLSSEQTYSRKLKEIVLAVKLESMYSKEEILEMYINVIYYGSGVYGIQSASQTYFNKNAQDLTLAECAMLAGLAQAPSTCNPKENLASAIKRQEVVLSMMAKNGYINTDAKKIAQKHIFAFEY